MRKSGVLLANVWFTVVREHLGAVQHDQVWFVCVGLAWFTRGPSLVLCRSRSGLLLANMQNMPKTGLRLSKDLFTCGPNLFYSWPKSGLLSAQVKFTVCPTCQKVPRSGLRLAVE